MFDPSLSLAARTSVTLTSLVFVLYALRTIFRGSRGAPLVLGGAWLVAAAFAHVPALTATLPSTFRLGLPIALAAAVASLFSPSLRRGFDSASADEMRVLLGFRAIYGALLFALAATGHFPMQFALSAGFGDLLVGWLAIALPATRRARLLMHAIGMADMLMVLFLAVTLVQPWSRAHGNATTSMTLPWLAVPLMFAINAHGLRKAASAEALGDGSEPAGRVRSALP